MDLKDVDERRKIRSRVEKKSKKRVNGETSFVPLSLFQAFAMVMKYKLIGKLMILLPGKLRFSRENWV